MLLPHGFEGQGPEHSSARVERFLMQAAEDNMQICQPTTPAQYFHLLRRQVLRPWRKPLIVFTPKSILRHPQAVSQIADFERGSFQRIMLDERVEQGNTNKVLLCTGKIYYELIRQRAERKRDDVAILRVEQLFPLREEQLKEVLSPYAPGTQVSWVQDEPENMGAWRYMLAHFGRHLCGMYPFDVASRPASASPATGSAHSHKLEEQALMDTVFGK
jgi:2-oxoglutarate dehydrogenase E1 component